MASELKLLKAKVGHRRLWPKKNSFLYRVFYVQTPIVADQGSVSTPLLFSFNKFNVLGLYTKDYGAKDENVSWFDFLTAQLKKAKIPIKEDYSFSMITHPRLFGYSFNPITFWTVQDGSGKLRAMFCEVHNTFKQTHNYLLAKKDHQPIEPTDIMKADKNLYVSPFNKMEGHYEFSFDLQQETFNTDIIYFDSERRLIEANMHGVFSSLDSLRALSVVFLYPFMTVMVVLRIHYQAVKLYLKKIPHTLKIRPKKAFKNDRTTKGD